MPNALSTAYRLPGLMAGIRPLIMLVGLAAAVALGVAVVLWSQAPTYSLLYSNLPDDDVAAVSDGNLTIHRIHRSLDLTSPQTREITTLKMAIQEIMKGSCLTTIL